MRPPTARICTLVEKLPCERWGASPSVYTGSVRHWSTPRRSSDDQQALEPDVFVGSTGVLDELEQCATIGDLHHALAMLVLDAEPPLVEVPLSLSGLEAAAHGPPLISSKPRCAYSVVLSDPCWRTGASCRPTAARNADAAHVRVGARRSGVRCH